MDYAMLLSAFASGFVIGFSVAKLIIKESHKLLKRSYKELRLEKQALQSQIATLESTLQKSQSLGSVEEQGYMQIIESLKESCECKDREIRSLQKRLNSFRFNA